MPPSRYDPILAEIMRHASSSYRAHDDNATLNWLEEALHRAPWRTDIRLCLACRHIQHGVPHLAVKEYETILQHQPNETDALFLSAHWHRFLQDHALSAGRLERLGQILPDRAAVLQRIWRHMDAWLNRPVLDTPSASPAPFRNPAVLILGLLLNDDGTLKPGLIARLEMGLALYRGLPNAVFAVSGGVPRAGRVEAVVMREWLEEKGVPSVRIHEEGYSRDIVENLIFSRQVLAGLRVDAVLAVTCAINVRRTGAGLDILSDQYGLHWTTDVVAASGATFEAFADDGRDRLKIYRDSLRTYGIPMMASYPYLAER